MSAIISIGTANPPHHKNQLETAEFIADAFHLKPSEKRLLKSVYKASGIKQRYSVLKDYCRQIGHFEFFPNHADDPFPSTADRMKIYQEHALDLALLSINRLMHFNKDDVTHLITVSCTGMYAPGIDIEIIHTLKLNTSIKRTAVNFMGCYGAFNAIKLADSICKSNVNATVLIVCIELCTIHFQKSMNIDQIIANSLFADGAASILVKSKPTQKKYFTLNHFHNDLIPQSNQEMSWHIGDYGFDMVLSTYVPEMIHQGIHRFVNQLLTQCDLKTTDIDFYAIHPGGMKILEACESALNISKQDNQYAYRTLNQYGNMSSATVLFVLKAIWDDLNSADHQKTIFSCAFGPGLTLESMLLKTHCHE